MMAITALLGVPFRHPCVTTFSDPVDSPPRSSDKPLVALCEIPENDPPEGGALCKFDNLPRILPKVDDINKEREGLVLCTLHHKWRHPDCMARKANGDWVCTGDDRCKGAHTDRGLPAIKDISSKSKTSKIVNTTTKVKGRLRPLRMRGLQGLRQTPVGAAPASSIRLASVHLAAAPGKRRATRQRQATLRPAASAEGRQPRSRGTAPVATSLPVGAAPEDIRAPSHPPLSLADAPRSRSYSRSHSASRGSGHKGRNAGRGSQGGSHSLLSPQRGSHRQEEGEHSGQRRGSRGSRGSRGRGRGSSLQALQPLGKGGDGNPPGTLLCSLHNKPRFPERLERRGGVWVCKASDRCRNVDEVLCSVHQRWRTTQNMEQDSNGTWACKAACACR